MHYLKRSLTKQEKCHFGQVTLDARRLLPHLVGQRGPCGVLDGHSEAPGLAGPWCMQGSEISVNGTSSLVPPSQSQNCWGGIQPLLLQCLRKCCELPAPGTLLFLQHCFLFGSLSLKKHVTTHDVRHYAPSPDALAASSLRTALEAALQEFCQRATLVGALVSEYGARWFPHTRFSLVGLVFVYRAEAFDCILSHLGIAFVDRDTRCTM